jgi:hypothetical protein
VNLKGYFSGFNIPVRKGLMSREVVKSTFTNSYCRVRSIPPSIRKTKEEEGKPFKCKKVRKIYSPEKKLS